MVVTFSFSLKLFGPATRVSRERLGRADGQFYFVAQGNDTNFSLSWWWFAYYTNKSLLLVLFSSWNDVLAVFFSKSLFQILWNWRLSSSFRACSNFFQVCTMLSICLFFFLRGVQWGENTQEEGARELDNEDFYQDKEEHLTKDQLHWI